MPNWNAYAEAERRGILSDDKQALYDEAKNRGLVPGYESASSPVMNALEAGATSDDIAKAQESSRYADALNMDPEQAYDMHDEIKKESKSIIDSIKSYSTFVGENIAKSWSTEAETQKATAEIVSNLAVGAATWLPSELAGLATAGYEKMTGATTEVAAASREKVTSSISTLFGLVQPPETEAGKKVINGVGKAMETIMAPVRYVGETVARYGAAADFSGSVGQYLYASEAPAGTLTKEEYDSMPNYKAFVNFTSDLLTFKGIGEITGIVTKNIKNFGEKAGKAKTLNEADNIAREYLDTLKKETELLRPASEIPKETNAVVDTIKELGADAKNVASDMARTADEYLGNISTRLGNIHPSLKSTLRKFEFKTGVKKSETIKKAEPFMQKTKGLSAEGSNALDLALKNGDSATIKKLTKEYGIEKEYQEVRDILDNLYKEAEEVGIDIEYRKDYHPRVVKDSKGMLEYFQKQSEWNEIQKAIREQETKLARYLTTDEKAQVINTMIRGYSKGKITLQKPGQVKARKIETITPELDRFYMDSNSALIKYINDLSDVIEARKLFGKQAKGKKLEAGDMEGTIGDYINRIMEEGKVSAADEAILRDILSARFNEVSTRGIFSLYKNISYIDTMGSPISAVTQIGDIAWALYKSGIAETGKALKKAVTGKSIIKKEDLGIERIAAEFSETTKSAKAVSSIFKKIGLEKMDSLGKETLINAAYERVVKQSKTEKGVEKLRKELEPIFEGETDALIKDLQKGNITENVKLYLFNELTDFQPVALSEMPQKYLTGGNGRIFYMLKSFTLKQFDVYRREVFQQIKNPETRTQGIKNLVKLSGYFVAANASADVVKDILLGRPIDIGDIVVDNMLRLLGISKFVTWKAREEGVGSALVRQIAPPFKAADAITKDINTIATGKEKKLETPASIPIVGKLYYWWFGRGAEKTDETKSLAR